MPKAPIPNRSWRALRRRSAVCRPAHGRGLFPAVSRSEALSICHDHLQHGPRIDSRNSTHSYQLAGGLILPRKLLPLLENGPCWLKINSCSLIGWLGGGKAFRQGGSRKPDACRNFAADAPDYTEMYAKFVRKKRTAWPLACLIASENRAGDVSRRAADLSHCQ